MDYRLVILNFASIPVLFPSFPLPSQMAIRYSLNILISVPNQNSTEYKLFAYG